MKSPAKSSSLKKRRKSKRLKFNPQPYSTIKYKLISHNGAQYIARLNKGLNLQEIINGVKSLEDCKIHSNDTVQLPLHEEKVSPMDYYNTNVYNIVRNPEKHRRVKKKMTFKNLRKIIKNDGGAKREEENSYYSKNSEDDK